MAEAKIRSRYYLAAAASCCGPKAALPAATVAAGSADEDKTGEACAPAPDRHGWLPSACGAAPRGRGTTIAASAGRVVGGSTYRAKRRHRPAFRQSGGAPSSGRPPLAGNGRRAGRHEFTAPRFRFLALAYLLRHRLGRLLAARP